MKNEKEKSTAKNVIGIFVCLALMAGNLVLIHSSNIFGAPLFFVLGFLAEIILAVILLYNVAMALEKPLVILGSVLESAWRGVLSNSHIASAIKKKPRFWQWLENRFDSKKPTGLILTTGIAISLFFFFQFLGIVQDLVLKEPLTQIDTRIDNLMPSIRTPLQNSIFRFITFLANPQSIVIMVILVVAILWAGRKKFAAMFFAFAAVFGEGLVYVLKHIVDRPRPSQALSIINEDSFSFPSGHTMAATLIFGLLAYLIFKSLKSKLARLFTILGYAITVTAVSLSRLYLGVHFLSDVLASILLGASILTLFIAFAEIVSRYRLWNQNQESFKDKRLILVPIVILVFSLVASPIFIKFRTVSSEPAFTTVTSVDDKTIAILPKYSETLAGGRMEPISFIYAGSQNQIEDIFLSHGWYKADPSTINNTLKAFAFGFKGQQYLTAPVTPSYLNAKPEDLAFQKPTQSNTVRQRHHTRLWRTNYKLKDGREIWVATASFDDRVEFSGPAKILPTHHIDPNIDAERDYILKSLGLENTPFVDVVGPQIGKNAAGDPFFTDGKAALVEL